MSSLTMTSVDEQPQARRRPRLLVSVRDVAEAQSALLGGADWIDLKEPTAGPLGAVSAAAAEAVVAWVAGRVAVSAALGELCDWPTAPSRQLLGVSGFTVVKLGLAGCEDLEDWQAKWLSAEAEIRAAGKSLAAVVYADWRAVQAPAPEEVVALAEQTACRHLLIDTFDKSSLGSLECLGVGELRRILNCAQQADLRTVLAGRINCREIAELPRDLVDIVAVRGGVCPQGRSGRIDARLVAKFRQALTGR